MQIENYSENSNAILYSTVNDSIFSEVNQKIMKCVPNTLTRGGDDITDGEAEDILDTLTQNGEDIVDQLLNIQDELGLTEEEIGLLNNMTDAELAELAYIAHLSAVCAEADEDLTGEDLQTRYTWDEFSDCLMDATGINDVGDVIDLVTGGGSISSYISGTRILMTANTMKNVAIGLAKRGLGWLGAIYCAYQLGECLEGKVKARN